MSTTDISTDAADLAAQHTATFHAQTGKRKFSAPFEEDGAWWILDSQGHQWCWCDGYGEGFAWERFTDDDDPFVVETRREKRSPKEKA